MWIIVFGGFATLAVLAALVGRAVDRQARDEAWNRIAGARRINADNRRSDEERAVQLDVREAELDLRERWIEFRLEQLFRQEAELEKLTRRPPPDPPALSA